MTPTVHPAGSRITCNCGRHVDSLKRIIVFHESGCSGSSTGEQRLAKPKVEGAAPSPGSNPEAGE